MKSFVFILLFFLLPFSTAWGQRSIQQQFSEIDSAYVVVFEKDFAEAFKLSLIQDSLAEDIGSDSLQLLASYHKAQTLIRLGFQDIALKGLYAGLKKAEQVKSVHFEYRYNHLIGQIYEDDLGDFAKALQFYQVAKQKAIEKGRLKDTLFINQDIANCYLYMNDTAKSLAIMKENLAVSKAINDSTSLFFAFDHVAGYYAINGNMPAALATVREIFNYPKTMASNYRRNILYNHLAEISFELRNWEQAGIYCDSMFKYAKLIKSPTWLALCYRMHSKVDEANKDLASSLNNFYIYHKMTDSLNKANYDKKVAVMNTFYELDKKQNQIDKLAKDEQISVARIGRLTLFVVALVLFSALVVLYSYNRKNKAEKILKEKFAKQLLDSQEAERQRVAKELHDSLGQNILFIKNQLMGQELDRSKLQGSVDQVLEEVRSISKDLYPNQLEKYGLAAAVDALGEQVQGSTGIFVSSDMQGIDEVLDKNMQINLYRIVQEFFNNSLKHANATSIRITTQQTPGEVVLTLQDNGSGFSKEKLSTIANKSFGMLNMEERVKMLKGRFEIETEPGAGTKMTFTIPV